MTVGMYSLDLLNSAHLLALMNHLVEQLQGKINFPDEAGAHLRPERDSTHVG